MRIIKTALWTSAALIGLALIATAPAVADQQILDDLIVDGSICVGFDCTNGETFGFDTIRIKENNLRIRAVDTSNSASFPTNDWQITFNDSSNGGANKFSIDDIDGGRTPFTIEASAPSHSLYVDDGGRVGFGTSIPVTDLHVVSGNTPTLRLEQNGSSGFAPQTWDVAGNEANFFIRDATNGSTLPIRLRPGAPTSAIDIAASGDVGFGGTDILANHISVDGQGANEAGIKLCHNGGGACNSTAAGSGANFTLNTSNVFFTNREDGDMFFFTDNAEKMKLDNGNEHTMTGNLTVSGDIDSGGTTTVPDYVFEPDYPLMPLDDLAAFLAEQRHLPNVPSAGEIADRGSINMTKMQMALLEKIEELTLYTLQQQKQIDELGAKLAAAQEVN